MNDTPHIVPTEWHRRSKGFTGPCPICNFPRQHGEHRATSPADNTTARWVLRRKTSKGWGYIAIGGKSPRRKAVPKSGRTPRPHLPSATVAANMGKAAGLFTNGTLLTEVARQLQVKPHTVLSWRRRWPAVWKMLLDEASQTMATAIRAMVGTDAIFTDPATYTRMAKRALKRGEQTGEQLFPVNGEPTLTTFFRDWYKPQKLFDAQSNTVYHYELILRHWTIITGDPLLKEITDETLALFRDFLLKEPGMAKGSRKSVNTVRTQMRNIQTLLDKCGPAGPRNRDGRGIIDRVPWAQPPRKELKIPKTVDLDTLGKCYAAADKMQLPAIPGVKPADWWRALLVVCYNTGLRARTLFSLQWDHIDWKNRKAVIPAGCLKSRRPQIVYLNPIVIQHLLAIRRESVCVFEFSHARRRFWQLLHLLQKRAGVDQSDWFGLHALRRTLASILWEHSPSAAQFALGHTTSDITRQHYVDGGSLVARAIDALPQPEAFVA